MSSLCRFWLVGALLAAPPTEESSPEDVIAEAQRAFETGNYTRAATLLQASVDHGARDAAIHYWLARCQYELSEDKVAVQSARRAVELEPSRSEYHDWLGRALGRLAERSGWLNRFSLARGAHSEFESAVRLDPRNIQAQRDLIEFYRLAPGILGGGAEKAWRQAQSLTAIDPVEGALAQASLWEAEKKPDRAEAEYRRVMDARPRRVGPYLEVAEFYERRRQGDRMAEAVEAAAAVSPAAEPLAYYRGVAAFLQGGRDGEAERLLRQYLETAPARSDLPSSAATHEWLGRLYEREGRVDAAVQEYREALRTEHDRQGPREALRRLARP
jgi:tetratricopeptide (TPR) repeat protein